jgi:hypothetical protein
MNDFEYLSYMSYIYMRKHHKEVISSWGIGFTKSSFRGSIPKDSFSLDGKITFPLMTKGEIFIIYKGKFLEKENKGMIPGGEMVTRENE